MAAALIAKAGCDLSDSNWNTSVPVKGASNVFASLGDAAAQGLITEADLDVNVKRLFGVRMRLGEFDPPAMTTAFTSIPLDVVQSDAHRELAVEAARKSMVLLKNAATLPLSAAALNGKKIAVVGPFADGYVNGTDDIARGALYYGDYGTGAFKAYWGVDNPWPNTPTARNFTVTVREALAKRAAAAGATLSAAVGCETHAPKGWGGPPNVCNVTSYDKASVTAAASGADVVVVCVGTSKFVEAEGTDRVDLALPGAQEQLLRDATAAAAKGASVVVVLFNAGGVDVSWAVGSDSVGAIVAAGFPGQTTGTAVADVLFGDVSPAGKLAVTWPKSLDQVPAIGDYALAGSTFRYSQADPLFPFGFGLSYTSFEYSGLSVTPSAPKPCDTVTVRATVANTGAVDADEVVLVFVEWAEAPHPTPDRSLAAFARVHVKAGASQAVELELAPARLAVLAVPGLGNASSTWLATAASVKVYVGGQQPGMAVKAPSNVLSAEIKVAGEEVPLTAC